MHVLSINNVTAARTVRDGLPIRMGRLILIVGALACGSVPVARAQVNKPAVPTFESAVLPILKSRCISCHGGAPQQAGGRREEPLRGGVQLQTNFFAQLADGTGVIILAAI